MRWMVSSFLLTIHLYFILNGSLTLKEMDYFIHYPLSYNARRNINLNDIKDMTL